MANRDSTANIIPDMPPWMVDHVAAVRKSEAGTAVTIPTTIPDAIEAVSRARSLPAFTCMVEPLHLLAHFLPERISRPPTRTRTL